MSRTRKPCPGCKEVHPYRAAGDVCAKCEAAIKGWQQHTAALGAGKTGTVLCFIAQVSYAWPGFYFGGPRHSSADFRGLQDLLPKLFHELARALAQEVIPETIVHSAFDYMALKGVEKLFDVPECDYPLGAGQPGWFKDVGRYTEADRDLFRSLYDTVARLLEQAYVGGVRDGQDVIGGLASGQTTIDELNEHNVRIAKRVQDEARRGRASKQRRRSAKNA